MEDQGFKIDFFGVGAPRSGTTWLAKCLAEHPRICLPPEKELDFFNKEHFFWMRKWEWQYAKYGLDRYKRFFASCKPGQIRGEFSVSYLYDREAPALIKKHYPGAKIILILRNPVDAAYSHYIFHKFDAGLPPIESLIEENGKFAAYGRYSEYIEYYRQYFSSEKMLIMFYDDLKKDPAGLLKKVYRFLGVDDNFSPACLREVINPAAAKTAPEARFFFSIRNKLLAANIGRKLAKFPRLKANISKIEIALTGMMPSLGGRKKSYASMPPGIRSKLNGLYYPEVLRLERLLGPNPSLTAWKESMAGEVNK